MNYQGYASVACVIDFNATKHLTFVVAPHKYYAIMLLIEIYFLM